jgi:hypothetical protein
LGALVLHCAGPTVATLLWARGTSGLT